MLGATWIHLMENNTTGQIFLMSINLDRGSERTSTYDSSYDSCFRLCLEIRIKFHYRTKQHHTMLLCNYSMELVVCHAPLPESASPPRSGSSTEPLDPLKIFELLTS